MSKFSPIDMNDLYYDVEQMWIDGVDPRRISQILGCPISVVYDVLIDMGVAEKPQRRRKDYNIADF
jgi:hypothetical protein